MSAKAKAKEEVTKSQFSKAQQELLDKDTSGNASFGVSLWKSIGHAIEYKCEFKAGDKGGWFVGPIGAKNGLDLNAYYDEMKDRYDEDKTQTFSLSVILQEPRALSEVTETLDWMKEKGYSADTYKRAQKQSLTRLSVSSMND